MNSKLKWVTIMFMALAITPNLTHATPLFKKDNTAGHPLKGTTMLAIDSKALMQFLFDITFNQSMPPDEEQFMTIGRISRILDLDTNIVYRLTPHHSAFERISLDYNIKKNHKGQIIAYRLGQVMGVMSNGGSTELSPAYFNSQFTEPFDLDFSRKDWRYNVNITDQRFKYSGMLGLTMTEKWEDTQTKLYSFSISPYDEELVPINPKNIRQ